MTDFTVQTLTARQGEVKPDIVEALRYMGYRKGSLDCAAEELIGVCMAELENVMRPACCYAYLDIKYLADDGADIGFGVINSRDLAAHLKGCKGVYLFAATIGIGADMLIAKYNRINRAKSVVTDALGSAAVEKWCDMAELIITENDKEHCSRFSPGYGDFSLEHQHDFMNMLDMNRRLGVSLSQSLLMTPTKSVTAVIGVGASNRTCGGKCAACGNASCIYRER